MDSNGHINQLQRKTHDTSPFRRAGPPTDTTATFPPTSKEALNDHLHT